MPVTRIQLPPGHQYAVTWDIPDDFAGMTNSMLHRSRALVLKAGAEVTILTYEHRDSFDPVRERLLESGGMIEGMSLRNLWEDLRTWDDSQLAVAADRFTGGPPDDWAPLGDRGDQASPLINRLRDANGRVLQFDYHRADGTLLVSNEWGDRATSRRRLTLFDTAGKPMGTLRPWQLYHLWLDSLPRDPMAWLICDSKTPANHLANYQRPDVGLIHVVRGSHLEVGTGRPFGELRASRRRVMGLLDRFDAVVFLTEEQRSDVQALLGPLDNLHVIPNNRPAPPALPHRRRRRRHGVMLAGLNPRKQIGQAIRAVTKVGRVRGRTVTLDVWGRGESEGALRKLIAKLEAPVRLRGHSPTAVDAFETASFSLLTSRSEAFANVLIESMGRGCIPISYDTPYGPSDIITHGVNGFLVPQDDIDALARQIREVASASRRSLAPIRIAAHERAGDFTDFTDRWAKVMNDIYAARQQRLGNVEA